MSLRQATLHQLLASVAERPAAPASQALLVATFPPHSVERLPNEWEWLIRNDNVVFVSCAPGAKPTFDAATVASHPALKPGLF